MSDVSIGRVVEERREAVEKRSRGYIGKESKVRKERSKGKLSEWKNSSKGAVEV